MFGGCVVVYLFMSSQFDVSVNVFVTSTIVKFYLIILCLLFIVSGCVRFMGMYIEP